MSGGVLNGIDGLATNGFARLRGQRVGLFTHAAAFTRGMVRTADAMRAALGERLAALFTPEHGFDGVAADGEKVASGTDAHGTPVFSLYGDTLHPTPAMFDGLDVIVCDVQDIGVRYYTYAWTLTHVIEAAGAAGLPVIVLDRPNPLGDAVRGPLLNPAYASLVGRCPVPVQHGMTLGELAQMVNALWNPTPANLSVVRCEGLRRATRWEDTGQVFVPPSPAMPHHSTARHYPGACLLEGTTLSEGRGTALPFAVAGAPFLHGDAALAAALNTIGLPGVLWRPHRFRPTAGKHVGEVCHGVQAHITGPAYDGLLCWLTALAELLRRAPDDFMWQVAHFDRLYGDTTAREHIAAGGAVAALTARWAADEAAFRGARAPYLLYD